MRLLPAHRHTCPGRRGQTLVEFALILPILALLLVMAVDFGRVFFGWISVQNAARVGASYAAAHADAWTAPLNGLGKAAERARYIAIIENDLQAVNCAFAGVDDPSFVDANGNGEIDSGELASVSLDCSFALITPLAENLMGGSVDLNGRAEFAVHRTLNAALPPPPAPPPPPTCTVPEMETVNRNTARVRWADASFQAGNLIEVGSGNFTVATQSVASGSEIPCTSSVTISESTTAPPPPTCQPPTANFSGTPVVGTSPLIVQFTDASSSPGCPILSWAWQFDPGSSTLEDPVHTFTHTGGGQFTQFRVRLTVTNAAGSDTESKNNYIRADRP